MAEVKVRKRDIQEAKRPDVLLQGATSVFDWLLEHRGMAIGTVVGVLVIVGTTIGVMNSRAASADNRGGKFSQALNIESRPVGPKTADAKSDDTFASEADRDKAAEDAIAKVAKDDDGTATGQAASLVLARDRFREGKFDEAIKLAQNYIQDPEGGTLKVFALETLGDAYAAKNDLTHAEDAYKKMADAGQPAQSLYLQGVLKARAGKRDEARKLFEKVIADYSKDNVAKEAHAQIDLLALPPAGVGDLKAPPANTDADQDKAQAKTAESHSRRGGHHARKPGRK